MTTKQTESFRGGAANPTPLTDTKETLVSTPESDQYPKREGILELNTERKKGLGKVLQEPNTGGGHRGATMRYGNDAIKPDTMNQEAKVFDGKQQQQDFSAGELTYDNACEPEKQLLKACIKDNQDHISKCVEVKKEAEDCQRTYGKYFVK